MWTASNVHKLLSASFMIHSSSHSTNHSTKHSATTRGALCTTAVQYEFIFLLWFYFTLNATQHIWFWWIIKLERMYNPDVTTATCVQREQLSSSCSVCICANVVVCCVLTANKTIQTTRDYYYFNHKLWKWKGRLVTPMFSLCFNYSPPLLSLLVSTRLCECVPLHVSLCNETHTKVDPLIFILHNIHNQSIDALNQLVLILLSSHLNQVSVALTRWCSLILVDIDARWFRE